MDYLHLIYQVPAIVSGTTMVAYLWPRKILPHFVPLLTFLVALIVLALPAYPDLALALTPLAAIIQRVLGISLTEHEPVQMPTAAQVRAKVRPPKFELRRYVTRGYPPPGESADLSSVGVRAHAEDLAREQELPPEHDPPAQQTPVKSFVPDL